MLPKYKYLLTYRYSEVVYDLTVEFCKRNISKFSRTYDQMVQSSRSGKQCIIEGVGQSDTSKKGEMKLLGVSKGSIEELIGDYEDFLRERKLEIWDKSDSRILTFRQWGIDVTRLESSRILELPKEPISAANLLLTLCHQLTFLLDRQIKALEKKFVAEGGFTENLFKKRLENKSHKKLR